MLIRSRMAITISPAMTQTSIAMPNISPPEKIASRFSACGNGFYLPVLPTHDSIQIAHNARGIAVPQKNIAVRSLDMHHLVAPHVSPRAADAANAVAAKQRPGLDRITLDRLPWNRPQAKSKHSDLKAMPQKAVLKAAP